jgi:hypothetical protein
MSRLHACTPARLHACTPARLHTHDETRRQDAPMFRRRRACAHSQRASPTSQHQKLAPPSQLRLRASASAATLALAPSVAAAYCSAAPRERCGSNALAHAPSFNGPAMQDSPAGTERRPACKCHLVALASRPLCVGLHFLGVTSTS